MKPEAIILVSLTILISSCSGSVKGSWTCPTLEGGKGNCISVKEADLGDVVNSNNNKTNKDFTTYSNSTQKIEIKLVAPKLSELKKLHKNFESSSKYDSNLNPTQNFRTPEKIGRIWFAPYIDAEGNQHFESVVLVVDEEPRWLNHASSNVLGGVGQ